MNNFEAGALAVKGQHTTLQQVHFKIQELSKVYGHTTVGRICRELESSEDFISRHIDLLIRLNFISFVEYSGSGLIKLTEAGKLTNVP